MLTQWQWTREIDRGYIMLACSSPLLPRDSCLRLVLPVPAMLPNAYLQDCPHDVCSITLPVVALGRQLLKQFPTCS